jgi:transcriptional regulator with XRE-family HTH domain
MSELGEALRAWRDRVRPEDVGVPTGARRRAVGLRREELAALAGVSTDYLVRLEQGRAVRPSPPVVGALARALRRTAAQHEHLLRLAGHVPPGPTRMRRHMTPALQRITDRLRDLPLLIVDDAWTIQSMSALGAALVGDFSALPDRDRNIAWRHFTGMPTRVVRDRAQTQALECELAADLHAATGRYPDDPDLRRLIADLRATSSRFAELWEERPVAIHSSEHKVFQHPHVGRIELDCDVLRADGTDLMLVVYSAPSGSAGSKALALLEVVGLQHLDPAPTGT